MESTTVIAIALFAVALFLIYRSINVRDALNKDNEGWTFTTMVQNVIAIIVIGVGLYYLHHHDSVLDEIDEFIAFQIFVLLIYGAMLVVSLVGPKLYVYWNKTEWPDLLEDSEKPKHDGDPTIPDEIRKLFD